ncbi:hypothetical protein V6Z12_A06G142100 [Gossypium hirsutum]
MEDVSIKPSGYKEYVVGLLAGVATVIVGHPFDTVKVKLQKHNAEVEGIKYRNGLHCTVRILATEGRGLYKGATSSFIGVAFESSLVFGVYSHTKKLLQGEVQSSGPQPQVIIPSAAFGGAIISFVLCPSELVKTVIQTAPDTSYQRNPFQVLNSIYGRAGVRGCYAGLGPTIVRAFPANAAAIVTWELAMKLLGIKNE